MKCVTITDEEIAELRRRLTTAEQSLAASDQRAIENSYAALDADNRALAAEARVEAAEDVIDAARELAHGGDKGFGERLALLNRLLNVWDDPTRDDGPSVEESLKPYLQHLHGCAATNTGGGMFAPGKCSCGLDVARAALACPPPESSQPE